MGKKGKAETPVTQTTTFDGTHRRGACGVGQGFLAKRQVNRRTKACAKGKRKPKKQAVFQGVGGRRRARGEARARAEQRRRRQKLGFDVQGGKKLGRPVLVPGEKKKDSRSG